MLHEDGELKISTAELLPKAHNLLKERFDKDLNLSDPVMLKDKETNRTVCIGFSGFILGAKSEMIQVASVHDRLMIRRMDFVIYFNDVNSFLWFDWAIISQAGYKNHRVDKLIKIPMWNFKVSLGTELRAHLDGEEQQEMWWDK